jgi:hypothetical protein
MTLGLSFQIDAQPFAEVKTDKAVGKKIKPALGENPLLNFFYPKISPNICRVSKIPDITSILVTAVGGESIFESKA